MPERGQVRIVGYRWVSNRGRNACPRCAALHGREFLFSEIPESQIPEPPLHPNCRCARQEIVEFMEAPEVIQPEHQGALTDGHGEEEPPNFMKRAGVWRDPVFGLYWRSNGSHWTPIYGKYCGKNWSRGHDTEVPVSKPAGNPDPIDDLDAACAEHDDCYEILDELTCDESLINDLKNLSGEPNMWRNPPGPNDRKEMADRYRFFAEWAFRYELGRKINEKLAREEPSIAP